MMKVVTMPEKPRKFDGLRIEVPGAIINIRPYLNTLDGHAVTSIEVIPDSQEPGVFPDYPERIGMNVRVYHTILRGV
jgi:hypothetical protein